MLNQGQVLKLFEPPNTRPEVRQNIVKYVQSLQVLQDQGVRKTAAQLATIAKVNPRTFQRLLEEADWDESETWDEYARMLKLKDVKRPQATVHIHQQQIKSRAKHGNRVLNIAILWFKTSTIILKCSLEPIDDLIHWIKKLGFKYSNVKGVIQQRSEAQFQQIIRYGIIDVQAHSDRAWSRHTLLCVIANASKNIEISVKPKEVRVKRQYTRFVNAAEQLELDLENAARVNPALAQAVREAIAREAVEPPSSVAAPELLHVVDALGGFDMFVDWVLDFKISSDQTLPVSVGFPLAAEDYGLVDEFGRGTKKAVRVATYLLEIARILGVYL